MTDEQDGFLPEETIVELEQAILSSFPRQMEVAVRIHPTAKIGSFTVKTSLAVDESRDWNLALEMLEEMNYETRDIEDELRKKGLQHGTAETVLPYLESLSFAELDLDGSIVENLKQNLQQEVRVEYDLTEVVQDIKVLEEKIIARCLPEPMSLEELKSNSRLSFLLSSAHFNPSQIWSYNLSQSRDVEKLLRDIGEYGILYRLLRGNIPLVVQFMKQIGQTDVEALEELLGTFPDVLANVVAGDTDFLEQFLNETITSWQYAQVGVFHVLNIGEVEQQGSGKVGQVQVGQNPISTAVRFNESSIVDYTGTMNKNYTQNDIDKLTELTTHNAEASTALLGYFKADSVYSYEQIAHVNGFTYFDAGSKGWEAIAGVDPNLAKKVNKEFLLKQMQEGKDFILSFNPYKARQVYELTKKGKSYVKELNILTMPPKSGV